MFVHSFWSSDQDLFKQKVTIIDFQAIPNSTDLSKLTLGILTVNKDYCRAALHREGALF